MTPCPYCRQPLPDPPERFCPSCGGDLQAVPPPAGGPAAGVPWENRDQIGFMTALVETTRAVLVSPGELFRGMPVGGGIGGALGYGMIVGYLGIIVTAVYQLMLRSLGAGFGSFGGFEGRGGPLEHLAPLLVGGAGFVVQLVLGPLLLLVGIFVATAIIHVLLMIFGDAQRGFEATLKVVCYSEATAILQIIPICGGLFGGLYWIVVAIIGLSEAHGTSKGTAAAAVLLPIVLVCCCCIGGIVLMAGGIASFANQMR